MLYFNFSVENHLNRVQKKRKISPKEKLTRKRIRQPGEWIDTKTKLNLNSGIEHVNRKGKQISGKKIWQPCSLKCRLKCKDQINEEIYFVFSM